MGRMLSSLHKVRTMYSVAGFLKTMKCSLKGHYLTECLIKAKSMTWNHSSVKAFLRKSKLTQSCDFLGQGHSSAVGILEEFQLFPECNLLYSLTLYPHREGSVSQADTVEAFLRPLFQAWLSRLALGFLFLDLDLYLALTTAFSC